MREYYTHFLVVTKDGDDGIIAAKFFAADNDAAAVVARALTRNWVANSKDKSVKITKEMVKLYRFNK